MQDTVYSISPQLLQLAGERLWNQRKEAAAANYRGQVYKDPENSTPSPEVTVFLSQSEWVSIQEEVRKEEASQKEIAARQAYKEQLLGALQARLGQQVSYDELFEQLLGLSKDPGNQVQLRAVMGVLSLSESDDVQEYSDEDGVLPLADRRAMKQEIARKLAKLASEELRKLEQLKGSAIAQKLGDIDASKAEQNDAEPISDIEGLRPQITILALHHLQAEQKERRNSDLELSQEQQIAFDELITAVQGHDWSGVLSSSGDDTVDAMGESKEATSQLEAAKGDLTNLLEFVFTQSFKLDNSEKVQTIVKALSEPFKNDSPKEPALTALWNSVQQYCQSQDGQSQKLLQRVINAARTSRSPGSFQLAKALLDCAPYIQEDVADGWYAEEEQSRSADSEPTEFQKYIESFLSEEKLKALAAQAENDAARNSAGFLKRVQGGGVLEALKKFNEDKKMSYNEVEDFVSKLGGEVTGESSGGSHRRAEISVSTEGSGNISVTFGVWKPHGGVDEKAPLPSHYRLLRKGLLRYGIDLEELASSDEG